MNTYFFGVCSQTLSMLGDNYVHAISKTAKSKLNYNTAVSLTSIFLAL